MSQCTADSLVPPVSGIGAAEREVDGAADLLVEQDRADRAVDAEVRADAELAEEAGARRRSPASPAGTPSPRSALRADHAALAELERRRPRRRRRAGEVGIVKRMHALGGVLVRAGEDLAATACCACRRS